MILRKKGGRIRYIHAYLSGKAVCRRGDVLNNTQKRKLQISDRIRVFQSKSAWAEASSRALVHRDRGPEFSLQYWELGSDEREAWVVMLEELAERLFFGLEMTQGYSSRALQKCY